MAQRTYAFRLTSEGFQELERDLKKAGDTGEAALNRIRQACPLTANALTQAQESVTRFSAANQNAVAGTRNMGAAIQQAGFQIGDFAVQVASGQGVLRPLIQQGTQFVSAFGPWGAVLGAAGAVAGALATALLNLGSSTEKAADAQKTLQEALDKTSEFLETAREKAARLRNEQRLAAIDAATLAAAQQAAVVADAQRQIAVLESMRRVQQQTGGRGQIGDKRLDQLRSDLQFAQGQMELFQREADRMLSASSGAERDDAAKEAGKSLKDLSKLREDENKQLVDQAQKEIDAYDAIEEQIKALREEGEQLQLSGRERAIRIAQLKAEETATKANSEVTERQKNLLAQEAGAAFDAAEARKNSDKAAKDAQRATERNQKELANVLEGSFDRVGAAVTQVSLDGENALKNMGNVGKAVAAELAQDFLKLAALNPLKNALFGTKSPTLDFGSIFDSLFNGGISSAYGFGGNTGAGGNGLLTFGGPRAGGGRVSAGVTYLVGEKRPELFTPDRDGTILPDARMGGGPQTVIGSIDMRGASVETVLELKKALQQLNVSIEPRAVAAVLDRSRRAA